MYKNLLIPVADDMPARTDRAVAAAILLRAPGAKLTLLHVLEEVPGFAAAYISEELLNERRSEVDTMLAGIAARASEPIGCQVVSGHGGRSILDYAEETGADCIVISSHRPELQDVFFGSTAAHVVRHAACSVHVLR